MKNIIIGNKTSPEKIKRAKELRKNMTPAEKILWEHLRAKRFKGLKFRRQQIIEGFIVDFYCHYLRLVIEVDGEIHEKQTKYDKERDKILSSKQLTILRFTNQQVTDNIKSLLKDIEDLRDLQQAKEKSEPIPPLKQFKKTSNL